jgi:hypothetical protein
VFGYVFESGAEAAKAPVGKEHGAPKILLVLLGRMQAVSKRKLALRKELLIIMTYNVAEFT